MKLFPSVLLLFFTINDGVLMNPQLTTTGDADWWKHATFYQIYPRSFKDDNNDGIGDLAGILSKLDHFPDMGVQAIWISPIFKSPQKDLGYDISDYRTVDSSYGTNEDLANLISKAHKLGIKVILDYVPNHTSNQHEWFQKSEAKDDEYSDYYIWMDAKTDKDGNRKPPNNWISNFKNSAWEWSEKRQQYYLHQFEAAQPDLNYRNEKVLNAMTDVIKYWLDQGVDGFRVDAVPYLIEDESFPDEPKSGIDGYSENDYEYLNHIYTKDQQGTFDIIYGWRKFIDDYTEKNGGDQRVLMTEAYTTPENTVRYYGTLDGSTKGSHFSFNFLLITDIKKDSTAHDITKTLNGWLDLLPDIYTPNWVIGNHDNHRVATRFGVDRVDGLNMMTAVLPGISVTYYGEEIGQEDGEVSYDECQDPTACSDPETFKKVSRDFERTPFQWDTTTNAGFNTGAKPWLPVSDKYKETNLASQKSTDGKSHYKIYQSLMKLRQQDILRNGNCKIEALSDNVLLIQRTLDKSSLVLVFNWGSKEETVDLQNYVSGELSVVLSSIQSTRNEGDKEADSSSVKLAAYESVILSGTAGSTTESSSTMSTTESSSTMSTTESSSTMSTTEGSSTMSTTEGSSTMSTTESSSTMSTTESSSTESTTESISTASTTESSSTASTTESSSTASTTESSSTASTTESSSTASTTESSSTASTTESSSTMSTTDSSSTASTTDSSSTASATDSSSTGTTPDGNKASTTDSSRYLGYIIGIYLVKFFVLG